MSPLEPGEPNPWTRQIMDTLADAAAVREGLHDDEALPLINWGAAQAQVLGARMTAPEAPAPSAEQVAEKGYALVRLLTRITWVVTYRHKKDAAWLTRTFHKINELSRELHGPSAPTLSEEEIAAWIAQQPAHNNAELVQDLLARLTPGTPDSDTQTPASSTHAPGPLPGRGEWNDEGSTDE